ncbi:MAG: hypothetical protein R3293_07920 [Candidatus Promineifilaceae bacterium]|nr:hypothetical protein [Candidatus Promineifilaceae bacterium]
MSSDLNEPQKEQRIPWLWLGLGLVVTIAGCIALYIAVQSFLSRSTDEVAAPIQATVIVLTAPPSPTQFPTEIALPPTPIPTFTPIPTPDTAVAPEEITSGFYVVVANTDDLGVTVRGGPSTRNVALTVAAEGTYMLVLDGPQEGDGFSWWQVQLEDGVEGWVVSNYLIPSAAP